MQLDTKQSYFSFYWFPISKSNKTISIYPLNLRLCYLTISERKSTKSLKQLRHNLFNIRCVVTLKYPHHLSLTLFLYSCYSWLPFLSDLSLALQVLHRIFPFARGLYEVNASQSSVDKRKYRKLPIPRTCDNSCIR